MILVIGGYRQGKLDYARDNLGVTDVNDGCFGEADCIYNLASMVDDEAFESKLRSYVDSHPDCVIICDEVGGGIVPLKESDRVHREKVGRTCCMLAKDAEAVYRVFCGIGVKIK